MLLKNDGAELLDGDRVALVTSRVKTDASDIFIYDSKSNLLHTQTYNQDVMQYGTIKRSELFLLLPSTNEWAILDAFTFKETKGKFLFRSPSAFKSRVLFFPESNKICILEIGDYNEKSAKLSFMNYPPTPNDKDFWEIPIADCFNYQFFPLNLSNRLVLFSGRVDDKIRWSVIDLEKRTVQQLSVNKPGDGGEYCLKNVSELKPGVYLLSIESLNPELRYMVYNQSNTEHPLRRFTTLLSDKVVDILSLGAWLYVLEFNVDPEKGNQEAPLRAISKETEEEVFQEKCYIGSSTEYSLSTTKDRFVVRVDAVHHFPKEIRIETMRATSQKELYVHLLKKITQNRMRVDMIQHVLDAFEASDS